jgi:hypothetical protein
MLDYHATAPEVKASQQLSATLYKLISLYNIQSKSE